MTEPSTREQACFEAGIKLGALYHQFVGTPVSNDTVESLQTAMEESVMNQRYVTDADVEIGDVQPNRYGYDELSGTMLDAAVEVEVDGVVVTAGMEERDGYPLMTIQEIA